MKFPILLTTCLAVTASLQAENLSRPIELKRGKKTTLVWSNASEGDQTIHLQLFRGNATLHISSGTNNVPNTIPVSAGTPVTFQAHWAVIEAVVETKAEPLPPPETTNAGEAGSGKPPSVPGDDDSTLALAGGGPSGGTFRTVSDDDLFGFYQIEAAKTPAKEAPPTAKPDLATLKEDLKKAEKTHTDAIAAQTAADAAYTAASTEANKKKKDEAAAAVAAAKKEVDRLKAAVAEAEKAG